MVLRNTAAVVMLSSLSSSLLNILCRKVAKFCVCHWMPVKQAFDKVLHHGLFVKLINKGVPVVFIRLLSNWYKRMKCSVLWNNVLGDVFDVTCGVRQGGVLSPILFSCLLYTSPSPRD